MGAKVVSVPFTCSTGAATQDITLSGLGASTDIKAVQIYIAGVTSDDTDTGDTAFGIGASDGTNTIAFGIHSSDISANSNTRYRQWNGYLVRVPVDFNVANDGVASFNSWITDGVRIDWDQNPPAAWRGVAKFFVGSDVSAAVGTFNPNATQNSSTSVTVGFEPDIVNVFAPFDENIDFNRSDGHFSYGFWERASDVQGCMTYYPQHGQATSNTLSRTSQNRVGIEPTTGAYSIEITASDSTTFTATTRDGAGDSGADIMYLAVAISGGSFDLSFPTMPTSTGSNSFTGVGFQPDSIEIVGNHLTSTGSADGCSLSISTYDSNTTHSIVLYDEDNQATTDCEIRYDSDHLIWDQDGTVLYDSTFTSLDSDGWTENFTTVPGTASLVMALCILPATIEPSINDTITITEDTEVDPIDLGDISVSDEVTITEDTEVDPIDLGNISLSDEVTITEDIEVDPIDLGDVSIYDELSITENIITSIENLGDVSIFDGITIAEITNLDPLNCGDISVSDEISIVENTNVTPIDLGDISVSDEVTLTEDVEVDPIDVGDISVFNEISISEIVNVNTSSLPDLEINVNDEISISEYVDSILTSFSAIVYDSVSIAESVDLNKDIVPEVYDSISISEQINTLLVNPNILTTVYESVSISENITSAMINLNALGGGGLFEIPLEDRTLIVKYDNRVMDVYK